MHKYMNITEVATAFATIIAGLGGAMTFYFNGRIKLQQEVNSQTVKDLLASNEFLTKEVEKLRSTYSALTDNYQHMSVELNVLKKECQLKDQIIAKQGEEILKLKGELHSYENQLSNLKKKLK